MTLRLRTATDLTQLFAPLRSGGVVSVRPHTICLATPDGAPAYQWDANLRPARKPLPHSLGAIRHSNPAATKGPADLTWHYFPAAPAGVITSDGDVAIGSQSMAGVPVRERGIAFIMEGSGLYPHLDVRRNIAYPLHVRRLPADEIGRRVTSVASLLGIHGLLARRPTELSGGARPRPQRLHPALLVGLRKDIREKEAACRQAEERATAEDARDKAEVQQAVRDAETDLTEVHRRSDLAHFSAESKSRELAGVAEKAWGDNLAANMKAVWTVVPVAIGVGVLAGMVLLGRLTRIVASYWRRPEECPPEQRLKRP